MIDLTVNEGQLRRTVELARQRRIVIPTFQQQINPERIPASIKEQLREVGLWEVNPLNLFRITWKNEPKEHGGLFGGVNFMEIPPEITGVPARIFALLGKWFPTGAHKVGATFGCLVPALVTGQFDPLPYPLCAYPDLGQNPPPPDPERDQRHIQALAEAMVQRYTARGGNPGKLDLLYWLHDPDALNNADAIKREMDALVQASHKMAEEMYKAAAPEGAGEGRNGRTLQLDAQGAGRVHVYGRIPGGQVVPEGSYSDTVRITMSF